MTPVARGYACALWLLLALFALRVVAQLAQIGEPLPWLPPFDAWHGGVLPYPALAIAQLAILAAQLHIARTASTGHLRASRRAARIWLGVSALYFAAMAIRLGLGLTVLTSHRWFGATLPAFFHLVLASFGLTVGLLHQHRTSEVDQARAIERRFRNA